MTVDAAAGGTDGLLTMARRVGNHVWVERRLFEWLGSWTGVVLPVPEVTVFLGEQASRHGSHAELLSARLPRLREVDAEELVAPVDDEGRRFMESVMVEPDPDHLIEALTGQYRVLLPVLLGSYHSLLESASPHADGSLARWLRIIVWEDLDEWRRGEALLRSLVTDPAAVDRAADRQRELERLLLGSRLFPG